MEESSISISKFQAFLEALIDGQLNEALASSLSELTQTSALKSQLTQLVQLLSDAQKHTQNLNHTREFLKACANGDFNVPISIENDPVLARYTEETATYFKELKQNLTCLASGDLSTELSRRSYRDDVAAAVQNVQSFLREIRESCATMADGNFQQPFTSRGEKDVVGRHIYALSNSLGDINLALSRLCDGDHNTQFAPKSHHDQLGITLQRLQQQLKDVSSKCENVAAGQYNLSFTPRSEQDTLTQALNSIVEQLQVAAHALVAISEGDLSVSTTLLGRSDALSKGLVCIIRNLQEVARVCQAVARGDLSKRVDASSDNDALAHAINQMIDNTQDVVVQAERIALGDYSAEIAPRGENDQLGRALFTMTKSLRDIVKVAQSVAKGDFSVTVEQKGEQDLLAIAINQMIKNLREVVRQTKVIADGDYTARIDPLSDRDELGITLRRMTENLQKVSNENTQAQWLKSGQAELAELLRGEQTIEQLAQRTINYLVKYINAHVGIIYLSEDRDTVSLKASYAFTRRKNFNTRIKKGQGIVGQVLLEKESILLSNVPENYIDVESGAGAAAPRNVLITPILLEGSVHGVVEIGTLGDIDDRAKSFVEGAMESIAIALRSAKDRYLMKELLEETQTQNEEMQAQSEELRVANEALEENTHALKESERILKEQQEELRAANEELEEKTSFLEEQKLAVQEKNTKIEAARFALEGRAKELELASKYKSEFLANMSHELRTPLNSLLILSKSLSKNNEGNLTARQVENATMIYKSGTDLLNLINEILDLSKVEAGKMETELAHASLKDMLDMLARQFKPFAEERGLTFTVVTDPALPATLFTDRRRVEQILKNLLSNAMKFTQSGSVTLYAKVPASNTIFFSNHLNSDNAVEIAVKDTGIGIPENKHREVFEAFQQADGSTSRKFGGTGLGLTISRELARILGGEIHLHSEAGKGATFSLFLPIHQDHGVVSVTQGNLLQPATQPITGTLAPSTPQLAPVHSSDNLPSSSASISPSQEMPQNSSMFSSGPLKKKGEDVVIVIEDDIVFGKAVTEKITERGLKGLLAPTGTVGLQLIEHFHPRAILLDLKLPDMDGMEILDAVKKNPNTKHIPVQVISSKDIVAESMNRGAFGYLKKPVDLDELELTLKKLEIFTSMNLKHVLLVEDDAHTQAAVRTLFSESEVPFDCVDSGEQALKQLSEKDYDCVIIDLSLSGMDGFKLLESISQLKGDAMPPVIVYTGKELTEEEYFRLNKFTQSIIVKGRESEERLVDEVSMFLKRVTDLKGEMQKGIPVVKEAKNRLKGKKVLLVDDDIRNVYALSQELRDYGLQVEMADNGQLALDKLAQIGPVDVVLMDIMMPVMDGNEAIRRIRAQPKFSDMPIIALTAKAMPEDRKKTLELGANDFLTKPVDLEELVSLMSMRLVH